MERTIRRGDIYYADLNPVIGSEQGGTRPVLIISNDTGNKYSPTVIIAAITSRVRKKKKFTYIWGKLRGFLQIQSFSLSSYARLIKAA